jgi:diadenosine tetraphosphatase ApaH/serine/threonine PP2A family protein phosphatase
MDWIRSLPDTIRWNNVYMVHDSPMDRAAVQSQTDVEPPYRELKYHGRGISPDMTEPDQEALLNYMRVERVAGIFCGHTHRPFWSELGGLLVCNVGSAGMPLDGDPRASWAMLSVNKSGSMSVSIRRIDYDVSSTLQIVDRISGYRDFEVSGARDAYKKMFLTGRYWGEHMPRNR